MADNDTPLTDPLAAFDQPENPLSSQEEGDTPISDPVIITDDGVVQEVVSDDPIVDEQVGEGQEESIYATKKSFSTL